MADKKRPVCKDCGSWTRKLKPPGPRCATCQRVERDRLRKAAHERRVQDVYGLPEGAYDRLYESQGGKCAMPLCKSTGRNKRLAVDHDHTCCSGPKSCGRCVRGLICGPCNDVLAVARDRPQYLADCINYLHNPPAKKVLDALLSALPEGDEGDGGGSVVPAPPDRPKVRRVGHEAIPGIDEYTNILDTAYRNTRGAQA